MGIHLHVLERPATLRGRRISVAIVCDSVWCPQTKCHTSVKVTEESDLLIAGRAFSSKPHAKAQRAERRQEKNIIPCHSLRLCVRYYWATFSYPLFLTASQLRSLLSC